MAKVLIVEDERIQRESLRLMIQEMGQALHVFEAQDAHEALEISTSNRIDLFYLDVHLPDYSGLELAKEIRKFPCYDLSWIIFVTSHVKYMLEAFKDTHCYDYVLKPVEKDIIQNMTMKLLRNGNPDAGKEDERKYIFIEISGIMIKVFIDEIMFVEVYGKTCVVHTIRGKYELRNYSLNRILGMMPEGSLIQSHRSYAVNIDFIQEINKKSRCWEIIYENYKEKALISDRYKENIINACEQYIIRRYRK